MSAVSCALPFFGRVGKCHIYLQHASSCLHRSLTRSHAGGVPPDYLAVVDLEEASPTYCRVIHRVPTQRANEELHHFGWSACSSCPGEKS